MQINDVLFNCDLYEVLNELEAQLAINHIDMRFKQRDSGNDIMICCPYHHENRPSAGIRKSDGLFHCFACGEVHTLYEMISHCFGYTEDTLGKFGWNWLLKNFATLQIEERKPIVLHFTRFKSNVNNTGDSNIDATVSYISDNTLDKYRYYHPYMYERGLTDEIIDLFDIGYDKDTDCITFPIRDINGNTLFVARRSVKTKFFNYPEGVEKPLYGLYEYMQCLQKACNITIRGGRGNGKTAYLHKLNEVIICESMLDALAFWVAGRFAKALNGLGNELQFKQLRELPCRKLILATDNDKRGLEARERIRQNVKNKLITEFIFPTNRKDANECLVKDGVESLQNLEEVF